MKKKALVTGGTKNNVIAIAVFIINIQETNPHLVDEIVIFHDGISEKDQLLINSIFPCRFIMYKFPDYDPNDFNPIINDYFSPMVFCKYECFKLLDEYRIVIWSDYDVIFLKDLSELLEFSPGGIKMISYPSDNTGNKIVYTVRGSFYNSIENVDMAKYDLEKAGVMLSLFVLFDNHTNNHTYYEWCIRKTKELGKHLYLPEQAIINLLLQEYNINIFNLEYENYSVHPIDDTVTNKTKILHSYGKSKFWNEIKNDIWESNYKKWVAIGGCRLKNRSLLYKIHNLLRKIKKYAIKILVGG
jgi:lipopolysaccharide biosynthesis glycosyltransferase